MIEPERTTAGGSVPITVPTLSQNTLGVVDLPAISLFSNCGAGDLGFRRARFQFLLMAELLSERLEICRWNHQDFEDARTLPEENFVEGDLRTTWKEVCGRWKITMGEEASPALLSACPPCQGMSTARSGIGRGNDLESGDQDERNLLVEVIADVTRCLKPKLVVVENVPAFLTRQVPHPESGEGISAARLLCEDLSGNYIPFPFLVDMADYDVPQHRQRTFVTFVRRDQDFLTHLREAGKHPYPKPAAERVELGDFLEEEDFTELDSHQNTNGEDKMHVVPSLPEERRRLISAISEPGGSAWENGCDNCGADDIGEDAALCPECEEVLPRPTTEGENGPRLIKGFRRSSYRRMPLDAPAPTVTTASNRVGSDYTIHPTEDRLMSPKECARLQKFPKDFRWRDSDTDVHAIDKFGVGMVREVIGEAIPPEFTRQHGEVLANLLKGNLEEVELIASGDERCTKAEEKLGLKRSLFGDRASPSSSIPQS